VKLLVTCSIITRTMAQEQLLSGLIAVAPVTCQSIPLVRQYFMSWNVGSGHRQALEILMVVARIDDHWASIVRRGI
jgi:hypothetical protein